MNIPKLLLSGVVATILTAHGIEVFDRSVMPHLPERCYTEPYNFFDMFNVQVTGVLPHP